jgi:hypothetical protein
MAKKMNEAYEVLKHSGSRMGYDLERQRERSQETFSAWKLVVPVSILTILLIFSVLIFRNPQTPVSLVQPPKLPSPKVTVPHEEPTKQVISSQASSEAEKSMEIEKEKEEKTFPQQVDQTKKTAPLVATKMVEPPVPSGRSKSSRESPASSVPAESSRPRPLEKQKPTSLSKVSEKMPSVGSISASSVSTKKGDRSPVSNLSTSIATEEEIGKLFNHYVDRYKKKDIEGFLSLFSPKVVQNQKDGLEEIRRIYENFFHQSLEIQYSVEDMKVEIYRNAVEVKARYELGQVLRTGGEKKIWKGQIQWMLVKEDGALKIISINYGHDLTP